MPALRHAGRPHARGVPAPGGRVVYKLEVPYLQSVLVGLSTGAAPRLLGTFVLVLSLECSLSSSGNTRRAEESKRGCLFGSAPRSAVGR